MPGLPEAEHVLVENVAGAPAWRLTLLSDRLRFTPPTGEPLELLRTDVARLNIVDPPLFPAVLNVELDPSRVFRLSGETKLALYAWLPRPTLGELVGQLRNNVRSFALPLGILSIAFALMGSRGREAVLEVAEGAGLIGVGLGAYLRPHRAWFAVVAAYFALLGLGHAKAVFAGSYGLRLPLMLLAVFIVTSDIRLFRRYRDVDTSVPAPPAPERVGQSKAGMVSLALGALALVLIFQGIFVTVGAGAAFGAAASAYVVGAVGLMVSAAAFVGLVLAVFALTQETRHRSAGLAGLLINGPIIGMLMYLGQQGSPG